jgi:hypothetical protein
MIVSVAQAMAEPEKPSVTVLALRQKSCAAVPIGSPRCAVRACTCR